MPFSEMLRMAEGKASTVAADLSPGDACRPGNDLMELVLENGQITMQGRPSRSSKAPKSDNFQSVFPKSQDGKGSINSKVSKFGMQESIMNDFELLVPSGEMGLDQDHDMVPWLNYSIGEPLRNNYCSDLSHELFGVTANDLSSRNNLGSMEKRSGFNHTAGSSHVSSAHNTLTLQQGSVLNASSSAVEFNRAKSSEVSPLMQFQRAVPGSGISGIPCNKLSNAQNFIYRLSVCSPASASRSNGVKPQKHDAGQPSCSSGFLNFSHFSRPALLARAALLRTDTTAGPVLNGTERSGKEGTVCATSSSNPPESSVVSLTNGSSGKEMLSYTPQIMPPANGVPETMPSKPAEGPISANQFEAIQHESAAENDKLPNQPHGGTVGKAMTDGAKTAESVFVASSVCSGCSMQRASNDPMHYLKRKCSDTSDSEGPSEEVEEESVGVRKAFPASIGTKRRRDADVHNLSERRRRDRINEKMRVLQELIPNCNKADKSSMLDEAIEYLKTLQLQVQILSMGAGLYMLPMMLPTRMQHMPGPHMSHFSPMGVGMGFGMNTLDMNGAMMQVPPIQGPPYPVPVNPISISSSFLGMTESSLQALGQPGQGLPLSMPPTPLLQLVGSPSLKLPMGVNGFGVVAPSGASHSVPSISSKDGVQDIGSQAMSNSNLCSAINQATNVGIQQPAALQAQAANAGEAPHPAGGNNIQPS